MDNEDSFLPLSALNDLLFCPRRCALHRIEGLWSDNVHTVEGTHAHQNVHASRQSEHLESPYRVERGLWLRSERLRLVGVADLVEFHPIPFPVEYKRGKRRRWERDDVQLCAQALCLEEMLHVSIPAGAIYHVRSRRRREVAFDDALRRATEEAVAQLHALVASGEVPAPLPHPKCKECSLQKLCLPDLIAAEAAYRRAAAALFTVPRE